MLVRGGPGADVIDRGQDVGSICDSVTTRFQGGVGNDCLIGSKRTNDVLLGALVFDHAIGVGGTDMVPAEVLKGCGRSRTPGRSGADLVLWARATPRSPAVVDLLAEERS